MRNGSGSHASSSAHVGDELARAVFFCPTMPPEPPVDRPATRKLRHPTVAAHIMTTTQPTGRNSCKHVDKLIFHINNDGNHIKYRIFIQTWSPIKFSRYHLSDKILEISLVFTKWDYSCMGQSQQVFCKKMHLDVPCNARACC